MNDKLLTEGSLHKGRDFMEIREYKVLVILKIFVLNVVKLYI